MNDLILKAREEQMIEDKTSLVKSYLISDHGVSAQWCSDNHLLIKNYVATTAGQKAKDIGSGLMAGAANWANKPTLGAKVDPTSKNPFAARQGGIIDSAKQGKQQGGIAGGIAGGLKGVARGIGRVATAPIRAAGKLGNQIGTGLETAAIAGQQANTGIRPNEQTDLSTGQGQARKNNAKSQLQTDSVMAGKPAPDASKGQTVTQLENSVNQTNNEINNVPGAPDLDALAAQQNPTMDQQVQNVNQQQQQGDQQQQGGQPQQAPKGSPQAMAQAVQIQQAQKQANTKGGFGTGFMSNLLTLGGAGMARGAFNAYQRNQGQQKLNRYGQGDFSKSIHFQNQINNAYQTIELRKGHQARNTTEMLRNGRRRQV